MSPEPTAATGLWPWLALAGLGAFHGLNPAMGWLFAVALGLHRGSRRVVLLALLPIALGHALAVLVVVLVVMAFGAVLDPRLVRRAAGARADRLGRLARALRPPPPGPLRHDHRPGRPRRLVVPDGDGPRRRPDADPAAGPARRHGGDAAWHHGMVAARSLPALAAVAVHSLAMLATTAVVAVLVYDWVGVGVLRQGWINLDLVWTAALVAVGVWLLV